MLIIQGSRRQSKTFDLFARSMVKLKEAFDAFGKQYYKMAEREYRKCHKRLPGNDRTARLRKKQHKAILQWFSDQLKSYGKTKIA